MRAVVLERPGQVAVQTRPDPTPGDGEVVVRVSACGICGSDLHIFDGDIPGIAYPLVPGHEFAGEVVEVGREVTGFRVGQRVAADPSLPCGTCTPCRRGRISLCRNFGAIGGTVDGAFAEYVSVPSRNVFALPGGISDTAGALLEPLACVVHGMKRLSPAPGDSILIVGAGAIGLMLLELALRSGPARVVVVERHAERRQAAEDRGAAVHATVEEALAGEPEGFDRVIDATGAPAAIADAFGAVAAGGTFLLFGVAPADATVALSPYRIYRNEIVVLGSMSVGHDFAPALALAASGRLELESLVTHTVGLEKFAAALALVGSGRALKCHVDPAAKADLTAHA
jgi:2-desacetyl-2-hydroxyethyl bacteriochlorophyllide A dehydrogenase